MSRRRRLLHMQCAEGGNMSATRHETRTICCFGCNTPTSIIDSHMPAIGESTLLLQIGGTPGRALVDGAATDADMQARTPGAHMPTNVLICTPYGGTTGMPSAPVPAARRSFRWWES